MRHPQKGGQRVINKEGERGGEGQVEGEEGGGRRGVGGRGLRVEGDGHGEVWEGAGEEAPIKTKDSTFRSICPPRGLEGKAASYLVPPKDVG